MAEQLPPIATETGKKMHGKTFVANEPIICSGETREMRPPGFDEFSLTDAERKEHGLQPGEEPCWIRHPKYWEPHEMKDRAREFTRQHPGRRIIRDSHGDPISNGDLILAVKCAEEVEAEEALRRKAAEEYFEEVEHGDIEGVPRWRPGEAEDLRHRAETQHYENEASGLIGPTAGMDYLTVIAQKGRERYERECAFFRQGSRHVDVLTEAQEARISEARERAEAGRARESGTGKFVSIPNNVRPKNFAGAKR